MSIFGERTRSRRRVGFARASFRRATRAGLCAALALAVLGGCTAAPRGARLPRPSPTPLDVERHPSVVAVIASTGRGGVVSSGFVAGPGVVVTTAHGVDNARRRSVRLSGGERLPVRDLLGESKALDLAALGVATETPAPALAFSERPPRVGERVRVVWAPSSRTQRTQSAVVSDVVRHVHPWGRVFRIDAALQLGCSGAPVLDAEGRVAGVVVAGNPSRGYFFAVPAPIVQAFVDEVGGKAAVGSASPAGRAGDVR